MSDASAAGLRWPRSSFHELLHRPANQLPALDGLRAFAVLLVICDHWVFEWVTIAHLPQPAITKLPNFYWGWTGVDLFFVLSGFLIGKQLWSELYRSGSVNVSQFVLRRGLRIWPLYYVCMLILLVLPSAHVPQWPDWVMYSNYIPTKYGRSWSLSTEEQFYLLIPTFLLLLSRFVPSRWWPVGVMTLLASVPLARALTLHALTAQGIAPLKISDMMYSPFHLHSEALMVGMLIAWVSLRRPAWLSPGEKPGAMATRVIGAAFGLVILGGALRTLNREVFAYFALACVYGASLAVALADRSVLTAVLRWKLWYPIARLSFGMYLNHLILREPTDTFLAFITGTFGKESTLGFLVGLVLTIAASAAMAAVTFVLVEQPGLAMRDRWLAGRKARLAAARSASPA